MLPIDLTFFFDRELIKQRYVDDPDSDEPIIVNSKMEPTVFTITPFVHEMLTK